jgi:phosphohistidine phosphatase SixA
MACLFLIWALIVPAAADEAAAWAALEAGGHVALMRHADAPGVGDPPGYRLDDCATQRLLNDVGRARAAAIGARLRAAEIRIDRVFASPWCRCVETAERLAVGPVVVEDAFSNAFVLRDQREALAAAGRAVIAGWRGTGTLLVVTHGENIADLTGGSVASGAMVVVAPDGTVIGRIPPPDP